jgi:disulfide bond formation protein DsbB
MALGVGALVGFVMRVGNGGKAFSILAAFLALFGCILGNYFSLIAFASADQHVGFFTMMHDADPAKVMSAIWEDLMSTSVLFYAIAAYEAYKFSAVPPSNISPTPSQVPPETTARTVQTDRADPQAPR